MDDVTQQVTEAISDALPAALSDSGVSGGGSGALDDQAVRQLLDAMAAQTVCEVFILAVLLLLVGLVLGQIFTRRLAA